MNSSEMEAALAKQAAQIGDLQAQVAALNGPARTASAPKPAPVPFREGVAHIYHMTESVQFVQPGESQLRDLMAIVFKKYPKYEPHFRGRFAGQDESDYFKGFCSAFEHIGHLGRAAEPNTKRYPDFWIGEAEDWFRAKGRSPHGDIGVAYFAALVAHGDVDYVPRNANEGIVAAYALATYGGKPSKNYWREVLAGSPLRTPILQKPAPTRWSEVRAG